MARKKTPTLPSGSCRKQVYIGKGPDGKRKYESFTGDDPIEVEAAAAAFKLERKRQMTPQRITLGEAMGKYIKLKDGILSPTTIEGYQKIRRNRFRGIMDTQLKSLSAIAIQQAVNEECKITKKNGEPLDPKTILNAYGFLTATLNVYYPSLLRDAKITLPEQIKKYKDLPEVRDIYNAIKDTSIELPAMLAMWLSFSESEIRGIRYDSIANGVLTLKEVVVDVGDKTVHKNKGKEHERLRRHKIPPYIQYLIDRDGADGEYIVTMSGQAMYKRFQRIAEKHGLPHMTFHDLRSVNASVMLKLNVPDKYAMERCGWKTDKTMKRVYQQTFSAEREAVDERIDDFFDGIVQHEIQHDKNKPAK